MFHNTRDKYLFAVADSIDFKLSSHKVLIYKHRVFDTVIEDYRHILLYVVIIEGDYHILPAKNVGWSHKHRIVYPVCDLQSLLAGHYGKALRALDLILFKELIKALSVLSAVDCIGRRSHYLYAVFGKVLCKLNSGLSSEGNYNAHRPFNSDDVHYVFVGKRFKIQSVGSVKIGGYSLGVVVDDNNVIALFFQSPYTVNRCIVELNSLSDTDRTRAENYNSLSVMTLCSNKL